MFCSQELMFVFNIILSLSCFLYTERSCLLFAGVEGQLETQFPSPLPSSHWSLVITHNYMEACIRLYYNAWQCALSKLEICISIQEKKPKMHSGHFIYIRKIPSFRELLLFSGWNLKFDSRMKPGAGGGALHPGLVFFLSFLLPLRPSWADGFLVTMQVRHWLPGALSIYLIRFQSPGAGGS